MSSNKNKRNLFFISCALVAAILTIPVIKTHAQIFAPAGQTGNNKLQTAPQPVQPQKALQLAPATPSKAPDTQPKQQTNPVAPTNTMKQAPSMPTGRNNAAGFNLRPIGEVAQPTTQEQEEPPHIFIYMRNFKVSRALNNAIQCNMRFFVHSTQKDKKLSNISFQLKWPEMTTSISLDDVNADTPTYIDYVLLGKGCYSMDKIPNIVVNRCRIKGLTQQQCANLISWVK